MEALPLPADTQPTTSTHALTNGSSHALTNGSSHVLTNGAHSSTTTSTQHVRRYLTCCVRLSPEKAPDRFVALVKVLENLGTFDATGMHQHLC